MKLSRFTIAVEHYPDYGAHLLFNTRTHGLVKIDQAFKTFLDRLKMYEEKDYGLYAKQMQALRQMGMVVQDAAEDEKLLMQYMNQKKYAAGPSLTAVILTTYNCNLACTYCFEESTRTKAVVKMDRPTSEMVVSWLKQRVTTHHYRELFISYFGGEPLINQAPIDFISKEMKDWCGARGIKFTFCLQTNGVLVTPELVDRYLPLGLKDVRISLDGTRETHDQYRVFRGSRRGSFDIIIENIKQIVDRVRVVIACGYEQESIDQALSLMDYFEEIGILHKIGDIIFSPIHPTLGPKGKPEMIQGSECMHNFKTEVLLKSKLKVQEAKRKKGLPVRDAGVTTTICPLIRENGGLTFDSHGSIYKCNSMLGHPELAVGHVSDQQFNARQESFLNRDAWKQCDPDCPYVPICSGGCTLFSFFKHRDFLKLSCEKSYMDRMIPEAVKQEYQKQLAARNQARSQSGTPASP